MIFGLLYDNFPDHVFIIFYVLNFILLVLAYKLGFAQKIPLLKSVLVYILLAVGTFIVALFSSIGELPTVESLIVIILILGIYRLRLHKERQAKETR